MSTLFLIEPHMFILTYFFYLAKKEKLLKQTFANHHHVLMLSMFITVRFHIGIEIHTLDMFSIKSNLKKILILQYCS